MDKIYIATNLFLCMAKEWLKKSVPGIFVAMFVSGIILSSDPYLSECRGFMCGAVEELLMFTFVLIGGIGTLIWIVTQVRRKVKDDGLEFDVSRIKQQIATATVLVMLGATTTIVFVLVQGHGMWWGDGISEYRIESKVESFLYLEGNEILQDGENKSITFDIEPEDLEEGWQIGKIVVEVSWPNNDDRTCDLVNIVFSSDAWTDNEKREGSPNCERTTLMWLDGSNAGRTGVTWHSPGYFAMDSIIAYDNSGEYYRKDYYTKQEIAELSYFQSGVGEYNLTFSLETVSDGENSTGEKTDTEEEVFYDITVHAYKIDIEKLSWYD